MSQSKAGSAFEAATNVAIGLMVSMITNAVVFPMYGFKPSFVENVSITLIYTAISFGRSYCLRRIFNKA